MATTEQPVPVAAAVIAANVAAPVEKAADAKKPASTRKRSAAAHPPYFDMIKEAIVSLKKRTGSSQFAIAKFIEEHHKNLPSNFKKILLLQLKNSVASGKLVKVKGSYKLPSKAAASASAAAAAAKPKPKANAAERAASKPARRPPPSARAPLSPRSITRLNYFAQAWAAFEAESTPGMPMPIEYPYVPRRREKQKPALMKKKKKANAVKRKEAPKEKPAKASTSSSTPAAALEKAPAPAKKAAAKKGKK